MLRFSTKSIFRARFWLVGMYLVFALSERTTRAADDADLILHHGKIVTVDRDFSIREALAVKGDRLIQVGTDRRRPPDARTEHNPGRPGRQDGLTGPDRFARSPHRRLHDRV